MDWITSAFSPALGNYVEIAFRKSSRSDNTNCVEVGLSDMVFVRDSKDRTGPTLSFTPDEWKAFIDGVKAGEFG